MTIAANVSPEATFEDYNEINTTEGVGTPLLMGKNSNWLKSPLILDSKGAMNLRQRNYKSPTARGGSLDQGSPESKDPVKQLLRKLRGEKRER